MSHSIDRQTPVAAALPESELPAGEWRDVILSAETGSTATAGLVLRAQKPATFIAALYSPAERSLHISEYGEKDALVVHKTSVTPVPDLSGRLTLRAEARGGVAAVSIGDDKQRCESAIVNVSVNDVGKVGLIADSESGLDQLRNFALNDSPVVPEHVVKERKLYDAEGNYLGNYITPGMPEPPSEAFPGWDEWGRHPDILLSAYRPPQLPFRTDWVLVMEAVT